ncbi:MAG: hypothetical protein AAF583_11795 [Pseudomonadota bacterium]
MEIQLPYTSILKLEGPDTIDLVDRIFTCSVQRLDTGASRPGALLTPQGKIIADFSLTRTENGCSLAVHPDAVDALEKRLKLFRLRADVDISRDETSAIEIDHSARIAAGQAVYGHDFIDAEVYPTEVNLDVFGGLDYKKGCFVGQEVVSRMYRRGKIRKRTVVLEGEALEKGMEVRFGKKRLGKITSASDRNALAILRTEVLALALDTGADITVGETPITVPLPDWLKDEMAALAADENA